MSACDVRPEYEGTPTPVNHPHGGRVRRYRLDADSQPPGHGSATLRVEVRVCDAHAREYFRVNDGGDGWQMSNIRLVRL